MSVRIVQVDAFTSEAFRGNPAAVCVLPRGGDPAWMQRVAREMNLSETAFLARRDGGEYDLRWFTPAVEETADPRKDAHFAGARVGLDYRSRLSATVVHDGLFTANANLTALSDYSVNARSAVSVSLSRRLALRVGLQLLYEGDPAPEDVAVIARAAVLDPDGMPGSGDELFETLVDGGATITLGSG